MQLGGTDHRIEAGRIDVVGDQLLADADVVALHLVQKRNAAFHRMAPLERRE